MAIPLPLVIRARLPLMRKVQLAMLFSVSLFVVSITIIRMPVIVGSGTMQQSRSLWASVEVLTACIVANAPVLNLFLHSLRHNSHRQQHQHQHHHHRPDDRSWQHQHGQQLPHSEASPASQRRRARMPVTGQDSFGSLTRNEGLDSPVCEPVPSPPWIPTDKPMDANRRLDSAGDHVHFGQGLRQRDHRAGERTVKPGVVEGPYGQLLVAG